MRHEFELVIVFIRYVIHGILLESSIPIELVVCYNL